MTQGAALDVERLEVLKGPQGTLFGQNATAGAINFIARKPTDSFEAGGSITFGRFSNGKVQGHVSGPLGDTVRARLAASREFSGDWQKSQTRDDTLGKTTRGAERPTPRWDAAPDLAFTFQLRMSSAWGERVPERADLG